jgi:hypothetical protein
LSEEQPQPQPQPQPEKRTPEEVSFGFDIMKYLGQAGMENLDPLTRWMLMQEMLDEWRERREEKRSKKISPEDIAKIIDEVLEKRLGNKNRETDLEKLIEKLNETWEKRFLEYQKNMEALLMGRKLEEAEKRAEEAEKKLKEIEEAKQREELMRAKIIEATAPLQERIKELQDLIAMKTAGMTNEEKKSFFEKLGEEIEKTIGEEVASAIAGTIKESLLKTFSGKEEAPVTPEGKINWIKLADKWISKTLDTLDKITSKLPPKTPPQRQITPIPELLPSITQLQQPTITPPQTVITQPSIKPETTTAAPTPTLTTQPSTPTETAAEAISRETPAEEKQIKKEAEEVAEEKQVEKAVAEESSEATGESSGSEKPQ